MAPSSPSRGPLRLARVQYRAQRGAVRAATVPLRRLGEGPAKARARRVLLRHQHSLPTELVVNPGDTVVQVGTPRPATMRRFRRAVGDRGRLFLVEAMPENQAVLEQAIQESGFDNVVVVRAAAFNENREGLLEVSPNPGDHKIPLPGISIDNILRPENTYLTQVPVRFARLDDELREHGVTGVDYLSVTVNGAELEVLKGAEGLLRSAPPHARVYAKGHALDGAGQPIHQATQRLLHGLGYRTTITKGEPQSFPGQKLARRAGDLYAWRG